MQSLSPPQQVSAQASEASLVLGRDLRTWKFLQQVLWLASETPLALAYQGWCGVAVSHQILCVRWLKTMRAKKDISEIPLCTKGEVVA